MIRAICTLRLDLDPLGTQTANAARITEALTEALEGSDLSIHFGAAVVERFVIDSVAISNLMAETEADHQTAILGQLLDALVERQWPTAIKAARLIATGTPLAEVLEHARSMGAPGPVTALIAAAIEQGAGTPA